MPRRANPSRSAAAARRAYLLGQPPAARRALQAVRAIVRKAVPDAVEHFSYGIPGFRLEGRPLVWYAGFHAHFSLFPIDAGLRRRYAAALEGYQTSTGTVRFPLAEGVPVALVTALVRARAAAARAEARAHARARARRPAARRRAGTKKR